MEFKILDDGLLIKPINKSRENWRENIQAVLDTNKDKNDDGILDEFLNDNDLEDFQW